MKWVRKVYALPRDPYGSSSDPGVLHLITLKDEVDGKDPFQVSTMMYLPDWTPEVERRASLELFETTAHEELVRKRDAYAGRDVVKRSSFVV